MFAHFLAALHVNTQEWTGLTLNHVSVQSPFHVYWILLLFLRSQFSWSFYGFKHQYAEGNYL